LFGLLELRVRPLVCTCSGSRAQCLNRRGSGRTVPSPRFESTAVPTPGLTPSPPTSTDSHTTPRQQLTGRESRRTDIDIHVDSSNRRRHGRDRDRDRSNATGTGVTVALGCPSPAFADADADAAVAWPAGSRNTMRSGSRNKKRRGADHIEFRR
jgi:hypothetical protein